MRKFLVKLVKIFCPANEVFDDGETRFMAHNRHFYAPREVDECFGRKFGDGEKFFIRIQKQVNRRGREVFPWIFINKKNTEKTSKLKIARSQFFKILIQKMF